MARRAAAVAALLAWSAAASAAEQPPLAPTRDAVIDYAFTSGNGGAPVTLRFYLAAGGGRLRVDQPGQTGFVVVDRDHDRTLVVLAAPRGYLVLPYDPARRLGFTLTDRMDYARRGTDAVAGIACTVWTVRDGARAGTVCISPDGLLLRGEATGAGGRAATAMRAVSVSLARQPDAVFQAPPDYRRLDRPLPQR